jgi:Ni2+-binding GTPase involved in maturation of urease and hydrogenase
MTSPSASRSVNEPKSKTKLIMVGGFLGAGKTTLLLRAAKALEAQGHRVAHVTNDQGQDLVDTALVRLQNVPIAEVVGGCFCCRFNDYLDALQEVRAAVQPNVILAEPVGSCTDLMATVLRPLRQQFPDDYAIAPFTVLVDAARNLSGFPPEVSDLYKWQLDEADTIALSKTDLLSRPDMDAYVGYLRTQYPKKRIYSLSAHTGTGITDWLQDMLNQSTLLSNVVPVDYIAYAEAEACLGWLNATLELAASSPFPLETIASYLLTDIQQALQAPPAPIAHIKLHLHGSDDDVKASVTSLNGAISWDRRSTGTALTASAILNARVGCEPERLRNLVQAAIGRIADRFGAEITVEHLQCFSPMPPQPTYRIV